MVKMMMTMTFFIIHFLNVDNNNFQTLENINHETTNNLSWSLITPYLEIYPSVTKAQKFWITFFVFQVQKESQYHFLYACLASYIAQKEDKETDYIYALYQEWRNLFLCFIKLKKVFSYN